MLNTENKMVSSKWSTYYQVLQGLINTVVVILVIYFMFFAFQGKRYTAIDGQVEKYQRITADQIEKDERIAADKVFDERLTTMENKVNSK